MKKIRSLSKMQLVALLLMLVGLAIMIPKGLGLFSYGREFRYAARNQFGVGNPSTDLLRPWMTLRFVAASYGVPQQVLYDATHISPRRETSMVAIYRLNQQLDLGQLNGKPALLETVRQAIDDYRAHPVVTGLMEQQVQGWMTLQYLANSTGIPAAVFQRELGLADDPQMQYKPLDVLSDEVKYPGGPRAFAAALQAVIERLAPEQIAPHTGPGDAPIPTHTNPVDSP